MKERKNNEIENDETTPCLLSPPDNFPRLLSRPTPSQDAAVLNATSDTIDDGNDRTSSSVRLEPSSLDCNNNGKNIFQFVSKVGWLTDGSLLFLMYKEQ